MGWIRYVLLLDERRQTSAADINKGGVQNSDYVVEKGHFLRILNALFNRYIEHHGLKMHLKLCVSQAHKHTWYNPCIVCTGAAAPLPGSCGPGSMVFQQRSAILPAAASSTVLFTFLSQECSLTA